MVVDPVDAMIRRRFIRAFMAADATRSAGVDYNPATLIAADRTLADYMTWLAALGNGIASGAGDTPNTRSV